MKFIGSVDLIIIKSPCFKNLEILLIDLINESVFGSIVFLSIGVPTLTIYTSALKDFNSLVTSKLLPMLFSM